MTADTLDAFFDWQRRRVASMPVPHLAPRPVLRAKYVRLVANGRCHDCGASVRLRRLRCHRCRDRHRAAAALRAR